MRACGRRVERATTAGADLVILGEMGIANTVLACAVAAALLRESPRRWWAEVPEWTLRASAVQPRL